MGNGRDEILLIITDCSGAAYGYVQAPSLPASLPRLREREEEHGHHGLISYSHLWLSPPSRVGKGAGGLGPIRRDKRIHREITFGCHHCKTLQLGEDKESPLHFSAFCFPLSACGGSLWDRSDCSAKASQFRLPPSAFYPLFHLLSSLPPHPPTRRSLTACHHHCAYRSHWQSGDLDF